jgi:hypothetical protein
MKRQWIDMDKHHAVSVAKMEDGTYSIAVMYRPYPELEPRGWEIDYSIYHDVMIATSSMEVYGIIKHKIQPDYFKATGWDSF